VPVVLPAIHTLGNKCLKVAIQPADCLIFWLGAGWVVNTVVKDSLEVANYAIFM